MALLTIQISNGLLIFTIAILLILIYLYFENKKLLHKSNKEIISLHQKINEEELINQRQIAELKLEYQSWAIKELEKFKTAELNQLKNAAEKTALESANTLLLKWKIENEAKIRQDAINRSYSVNLGKITEHLLPFHESFLTQFNPKDARFIGSPIDLIIFDGYADQKNEIQIYLVEIKTGNSKLTEIQKKIKDAVLNGNIRWAEINPQKLTEENQKVDVAESIYADSLLMEFTNLENFNELIDSIVWEEDQLTESITQQLQFLFNWIERKIISGQYKTSEAVMKGVSQKNWLFSSEQKKLNFLTALYKVFLTKYL